MNKHWLLILLILACSLQLNAQQVSQKIQRATWYKIMSNDSSYNYLDAQKEFQGFYKEYQAEQKKEQRRRERNRSTAEESHLESLTELLVADFLRWSVAIKPFVLADGSILPLSKRLAIINENKTPKTGN